jgi:Glycoside hydrolase 123, catalytic domain
MLRNICIAVILFASCAAAAGEPRVPVKKVPAGTRDILTGDSYWRWHVTMGKPLLTDEDGGVVGSPGLLKGVKRSHPGFAIDHLISAPPPAGWAGSDFDDSEWPRSRLKWLVVPAFAYYSSLTVRLRGKFAVTDPAAVEGLYLRLKYRGGVTVYLNGREVARAHLPEGRLTAETEAHPYPKDVYADAEGRPIPSTYSRRKLPGPQKKDLQERVARRWRSLGPVKLPAAALRKGINVLSVEVRRSRYHPVALTWFSRKNVGRGCWWTTAHLADLRLQVLGRGVAPNISRPEGLQVWTQDRNDRVTVLDYGDPHEKLHPMRLSGARNGSFCGQVVVGSPGPVKGLKVVPGDLRADEGVISASRITVLYGRFDRGGSYHYRARAVVPAWCDGLGAELPKEVSVYQLRKGTGSARRPVGAVLPLLVRVRVPRETPAGDYRGQVTISAEGHKPVVVPIELHVADWTVPDPRNFRTYVGIYQSPTSVALRYKVQMWSEEHWKLLEKSFALLGRVGNKLVNLYAIEQTQFGNDRGMIYWVKKPDGSFAHDFSIFDRYMKLTAKHCGKQDYVALHVWHAAGWFARKVDTKCTVTVKDSKTGKFSSLQVPVFGTEESRKFWEPLLAATQQRLQKLSMEKALCLGILSDATAQPEVLKMFDSIWPGGGPARWMRGCHVISRKRKPYPLRGGGQVVLHEHWYGVMGLPDPEKPLPPVWNQRGWPVTTYFRMSEHSMSLIGHRMLAEWSLLVRKQGLGRICLDFWPVLDGKGRKGQSDIYNRYPHSSCNQRQPAMKEFACPGEQGAESTVRFEALIEGLQEAEAMIVISEALDRHAEKLGKELAGKCRKVLVDRLRYCRAHALLRSVHIYRGKAFHTNHYGWRDLSRRLYDCAAQVGEKLGK